MLMVKRKKKKTANAGDVRDMDLILRQGDPLEEGMATHSSILAWRIPWTAACQALLFTGSQESGTT